MNNLFPRIDTIKNNLNNLISDNLDILKGTHNFTGVNILNFKDVDLLLVLLKDTSSDEDIVDKLEFIYSIGNSFFAMFGTDNVPSEMLGGYTLSNINLLRVLGHPKFLFPIKFQNDEKYLIY